MLDLSLITGLDFQRSSNAVKMAKVSSASEDVNLGNAAPSSSVITPEDVPMASAGQVADEQNPPPVPFAHDELRSEEQHEHLQ